MECSPSTYQTLFILFGLRRKSLHECLDCSRFTLGLLVYEIFTRREYFICLIRAALPINTVNRTAYRTVECSRAIPNNLKCANDKCHPLSPSLFSEFSSFFYIMYVPHFRQSSFFCTALYTGLSVCTKLETLFLFGNELSDAHARHIVTVIHANRTSLLGLSTHANELTSTGHAEVLNSVQLCCNLVSLLVGGSECKVQTSNFESLRRVLLNCINIQYVTLCEYLIGQADICELMTCLSSLRLKRVYLQRIGITENHSAAVDRLLQQQHPHLEHLSLAGNQLTEEFLRTVRNSLSQCASLTWVDLSHACLSSVSLVILESLLQKWPRLKELRLHNNDFSSVGEDAAESFATTVVSCSSLQLLEMPVRRLVSERLTSKLEEETRHKQVELKFESTFWPSDRKPEGESQQLGAVEVDSEEDNEESDGDIEVPVSAECCYYINEGS